MTAIKKQYQKLQQAYEDVQQTGYGIVMPEVEELTLEEPKILKQNGKYGDVYKRQGRTLPRELIQYAVQCGGSDNITAAVIFNG